MSAWKLATVGNPCAECGAPLRSDACWSCDGAAASPFFMCDECGDKGQSPCVPTELLTCLRGLTKKWPIVITGLVQRGNTATHSAAECERDFSIGALVHKLIRRRAYPCRTKPCRC